MYCNKKCFVCRNPLERDECSHFSSIGHLSSIQVHNAAVIHVLVCDACHPVSPTGRCLGFIDEQSRCENTCKESELFCCDEHCDTLKLVDQLLTDDITEDTDRGSADRYRRAMREAVLQASGGKCHYCGIKLSRNNWHADHKQPVALGGRTTLENGVAACPSCNLRKGATPYRDFCRQEGIRPH